ncbi:hypothetical protein HBH64_007670 [Parastagonospora nodorum]|nr:hypothetical protein HBI10_015990 [Parastagonospora nodorum]KAH4025789.1 hypothetical protein HBI13_069920 [Parastagonospora nodorum]KAH4312744.1 hypothetical protein HBI01_005210 [Parastagonospora nodorum]KAH4316224.1 hypothetical protein HBI02_042810 [Parastagonospora nodorum]KAH4332340.1 hypothetical protein HBI00_057260 [Parastagonospora nodorum]
MSQANRALDYVWDARYGRYKRQVYTSATGQWLFAEWMPVGWQPQLGAQQTPSEHKGYSVAPSHSRVDSGNQNVNWAPIGSFASATSSHVSAATAGASIATSPYQPQYSRNGREFPRGEGPRIDGTYIGPPSLHYEKIDGSFYVRNKDFFIEGKVFAVIMNETAGETTKIPPNPLDYNTSSSLNRVKYQDNIVYTNVRRFVVVRQRREFCFACPIFTYSGRATTKHGVRAAEHGVAYSWGSDPQLVKGESGITKASIAVVMADGVGALTISSRIYYGIHHPIQYNVKVKDIGYVPQSHIPTLIGNWKEEDDRESRQAAAVTAAAGEPELEVLTEEDEEEELAVQHTGKGKMKATRKTAQSAAKYVDPHIYHVEANPYGYDVDCNPHMFHPKHNRNGYHPENNPHGYHPESNPYMFHPIYNVQGYHPKHNVYGYHPGWNKFGFHHQNSPFCFHPKLNPHGYHSTDNTRGYHPQAMPYNYHPRGNPYGYHSKLIPYGYHPVKNEHGFHPKWNKRGYHPEHNPQAYHPKWNKDGVYRTQEDESDEDEAEDDESSDEDDANDEGEAQAGAYESSYGDGQQDGGHETQSGYIIPLRTSHVFHAPFVKPPQYVHSSPESRNLTAVDTAPAVGIVRMQGCHVIMTTHRL